MKSRQETTFGMIFKQWPLKPLTEVAFFQEGPGLRKWQWTESGMKVINVTNILGDGSVDINNTARFISHEEFENKYRHFAVAEGDIVIASSGNTYGKVGRINRCHLPIMMNTSVIRFHPANPNTLDQDFLYAFLRSHLFKNQMESFVIGSAQPNFGPSHLKQMLIPCPDLPTQRKIAGVLSAYDDLIENNSRRIAILEEMAQAIYREWFVNFRFPGHENVKPIDSPLGKIPEGWRVVRLDSLKAEERYAINGGPFGSKLGTKDYVSVGIPVIRGVNLSEGGCFYDEEFVFVSPEKAEDLRANAARPGDIVVTQRGTLGQIARIPHKSRYPTYIISQSQMKITLSEDKATSGYVYYFLRSKDSIIRIKNLASSSGVPHINLNTLREFEVVLPTHSLQVQFSAFVESVESAINVYERQSRNLRTTRDLLLPKLISGQLDVEDLDIEIREQPVEATT